MFINYSIQEVDVLVGVIGWLHENGWVIDKISIPNGAILSHIQVKQKIKESITNVDFSLNNVSFRHEGEDIRAKKNSITWKIECKGLTGGKNQTIKNNFDRAVASCVSYFTTKENLQIGLALPEWYKNYFPSKLPQACRIALNLWIFLYVNINEIYVFSPSEEIPV